MKESMNLATRERITVVDLRSETPQQLVALMAARWICSEGRFQAWKWKNDCKTSRPCG
jgi:hypothetical protein